LQVFSVGDPLSDPEMVDFFWHSALINKRKRSRPSSGDDGEFPSQRRFNCFCQRSQFFHFIRSCVDGSVTTKIGSDSKKIYMVKRFGVQRSLDQIIFIIKTLPKITEIGHQNDTVSLVGPEALLVDRIDDRHFTV
jgi:hypothetical protein